jgi:hypothetical protein
MADRDDSAKVMAVANLREFFRDALHTALDHQHVSVEDQTEHYVVNVLTLFSRSEAVYDHGPQGAHLKPLAVLLSEALEAPSTGDRNRGLQRLGDLSLFQSGFFARGFSGKIVDIDYHIAMGKGAYGTLAETLTRGRSHVLGQVFDELARKFQPVVDALNEISESSHRHTDEDVLRLYELWLKTGSRRCYGLLKQLGVDPAVAPGSALLTH